MKVLQRVQTLGDVALRLRFFEHLSVFFSSPFWGRNPVSSHESGQSLVLADDTNSITGGALGVSKQTLGYLHVVYVQVLAYLACTTHRLQYVPDRVVVYETWRAS